MKEENSDMNAMGDFEYLAFEVGGQKYAIDISTVREIRGWTEPSKMPNTSPHVMGVINLRGEALPLLDLAAQLGLQTPKINERSVIIVVEAEDSVLGFLVDAVSNIIAPAQDDMKPPLEATKGQNARFVSALTVVEDELTRILDLSELLAGDERSTENAA